MGGGPCAEAGDSGTDTGDAQVSGEPGAGAGKMTGLGLDATVFDDGGRSRDWGQGGVYRSIEGGSKKVHYNN